MGERWVLVAVGMDVGPPLIVGRGVHFLMSQMMYLTPRALWLACTQRAIRQPSSRPAAVFQRGTMKSTA